MECIREEEEKDTTMKKSAEEGKSEEEQLSQSDELRRAALTLMATVQTSQEQERDEHGDGGEGGIMEEVEGELGCGIGEAGAAGGSMITAPSAVDADSAAGAEVKPLVRRARKLLFRRLRVGVEDGRAFVGNFHCLDKQGNIILYDTMEFSPISPLGSSSSSSQVRPAAALEPRGSSSVVAEAPMERRSLGLVLIPARCRTSLFVECSLNEQFSLLCV